MISQVFCTPVLIFVIISVQNCLSAFCDNQVLVGNFGRGWPRPCWGRGTPPSLPGTPILEEGCVWRGGDDCWTSERVDLPTNVCELRVGSVQQPHSSPLTSTRYMHIGGVGGWSPPFPQQLFCRRSSPSPPAGRQDQSRGGGDESAFVALVREGGSGELGWEDGPAGRLLELGQEVRRVEAERLAITGGWPVVWDRVPRHALIFRLPRMRKSPVDLRTATKLAPNSGPGSVVVWMDIPFRLICRRGRRLNGNNCRRSTGSSRPDCSFRQF